MKMKSARTAVLALTISLYGMTATGQEVRKLLAQTAPIYPDIARRLNLEGTVKIAVIVGPDGKIRETKVIGGHPILVEAALKALQEWKYERASTDTKIQLEFSFHH
jgi:TonB family protein